MVIEKNLFNGKRRTHRNTKEAIDWQIPRNNQVLSLPRCVLNSQRMFIYAFPFLQGFNPCVIYPLESTHTVHIFSVD